MSDATERNDANSRLTLRAAAVGLFCVAISVVLGIYIVKNFLVFYVEDVGDQQSVRISSRFSYYSPGIDVGSGPATLTASTFPGARYEEDVKIGWYGGPSHPQTHLIVYRYSTQESLPKVAEWYAHELGDEFAKTSGWQASGQNEQNTWRAKVSKADDPSALLFSQTLTRRVRGVLLQTAAESGRAKITVYDFQR